MRLSLMPRSRALRSKRMSTQQIHVLPLPPTPARSPESPHVDAIFPTRWSRRALSTEPVADTTLSALFEAARWAPSANNGQPWLFVYANDEAGLSKLRPLVIDRNRRWADRAPVLILVFAQRFRTGTREPLRTSAFDTGAAWMSLALQAERLGLAARAMGGIHLDATYDAAGVSRDDYEIMCAIAIGHRAEPSSLPDDLEAKEKPSMRKALAEVALRVRQG